MRRVCCLSIGILLGMGTLAGADSIRVRGKLYERVYVREGASMYYIQIPQDGSVINVPKSDVKSEDLIISPDATLREALLLQWRETREEHETLSDGAHSRVQEDPARPPTASPDQASPKHPLPSEFVPQREDWHNRQQFPSSTSDPAGEPTVTAAPLPGSEAQTNARSVEVAPVSGSRRGSSAQDGARLTGRFFLLLVGLIVASLIVGTVIMGRLNSWSIQAVDGEVVDAQFEVIRTAHTRTHYADREGNPSPAIPGAEPIGTSVTGFSTTSYLRWVSIAIAQQSFPAILRPTVKTWPTWLRKGSHAKVHYVRKRGSNTRFPVGVECDGRVWYLSDNLGDSIVEACPVFWTALLPCFVVMFPLIVLAMLFLSMWITYKEIGQGVVVEALLIKVADASQIHLWTLPAYLWIGAAIFGGILAYRLSIFVVGNGYAAAAKRLESESSSGESRS